MKKTILGIGLVISLFLTGCENLWQPQEYYNAIDKQDFQSGGSVKFQLVQFRQVLDEKTLKEMNLNGGFFLFMGGVSATSTERKEIQNNYYAYLKNKNGGMYFAKIPADKVRVYEDAESVPYIVAYQSGNDVDVNYENRWDNYTIFNLHVPKGTIIPKIDNISIGLDGLSK